VAFQRRKSDDIGVKAPLPGFIEPALASAIERVPSGSRWIHEIKFDGYRVQVHLANEAVQIFTRRGHDWTHRFKKVAHDAWHIKAGSAVIDGEIVVPAADGTTDFSVLQNELNLEMISCSVNLKVWLPSTNDAEIVFVGLLANTPDIGRNDHVLLTFGRCYVECKNDHFRMFGESFIDQFLSVDLFSSWLSLRRSALNPSENSQQC